MLGARGGFLDEGDTKQAGRGPRGSEVRSRASGAGAPIDGTGPARTDAPDPASPSNLDKLRESEEKYRMLVEAAQRPIAVIDRDGTIRFVNTFGATVLGGEPADIIGRSLFEVFPPPFAEMHRDEIRSVIDAGTPIVSRSQTVIQGEARWYEARTWPLKHPRGTRTALVVLQDITEQVESEQQILSYQERLRTLTSELALAELRERRRIAAALHDGIAQNLALARMKVGAVAAARSAAGRRTLLEDIGALLDASIQDTRTLTIDLSPPILYDLGLDAALGWLTGRVRQREGLRIDYAGDGLPVGLAGEQLGMVFQSVQELLVNVVKHARARNVRLVKRCEDGRLIIEVDDDGVGYDPTQAAAGAGFGLFNIRERLRHLGGTIEVRTAPGAGTRATLCVPLGASGSASEEDQGA